VPGHCRPGLPERTLVIAPVHPGSKLTKNRAGGKEQWLSALENWKRPVPLSDPFSLTARAPRQRSGGSAERRRYRNTASIRP